MLSQVIVQSGVNNKMKLGQVQIKKEEIRILYSSSTIVRMMKLENKEWAGQATRMGNIIRNTPKKETTWKNTTQMGGFSYMGLREILDEDVIYV